MRTCRQHSPLASGDCATLQRGLSSGHRIEKGRKKSSDEANRCSHSLRDLLIGRGCQSFSSLFCLSFAFFPIENQEKNQRKHTEVVRNMILNGARQHFEAGAGPSLQHASLQKGGMSILQKMSCREGGGVQLVRSFVRVSRTSNLHAIWHS